MLAVLIGLLNVPLGCSGCCRPSSSSSPPGRCGRLTPVSGTRLVRPRPARRCRRGWRDRCGPIRRCEQDEPPANPWAAPAQSVPTVEAPAPPVRSTHRPPAVLAAGLVTVIGSSLVGGFSALYLVIYGFARDEYLAAREGRPVRRPVLRRRSSRTTCRSLFWACLVMLPLAVAGLAAGLSLLARLPVGRAATLALAWITAAGGVVLPVLGLPPARRCRRRDLAAGEWPVIGAARIPADRVARLRLRRSARTPVRLPPLPCQPSATPRAPRTGPGRHALSNLRHAGRLEPCPRLPPCPTASVRMSSSSGVDSAASPPSASSSAPTSTSR